MKAVVTIKLQGKGKWHNPKIKGKCPVNGNLCTDSTALHHSYLEEGKDMEEIKSKAKEKYGHVTRIETVE